MPLVQNRSLDLLTCSLAFYHCATAAPRNLTTMLLGLLQYCAELALNISFLIELAVRFLTINVLPFALLIYMQTSLR